LRIVLSCVRYPPAPGGAEDHVAALAEAYLARGHEVEVHTTDLFKEVPFERRDLPSVVHGVRVVRHRAYTPGRTFHYTFPPSMLAALVEAARDADVLHTHSYGYFQTMASARAARKTATPLVFTPHFHPPWSMEGGAARKAMRTVYDPTFGRAVLARADRVIGVSTGEIEEMRKHLPLDMAKVRVVPNGFHHERFQPAPSGAPFRAHLGIDDATPLVVFAGRLASNKGLHVLVPAFAKLASAHPDALLVLAGEDQDQRARLQGLAKDLGIAARVRFPGHLHPDLYPSALAAADVFVLPSEWEAFGIVLAQAMACGAPCVATRVGGAPDVVVDGETGRLVPYGDADALAAALDALLRDPDERRRMGEAGRRRAFAEYSWARVAERTLALYGELL
jgi:glycosyltransferase involved in cell wall biosynthesis